MKKLCSIVIVFLMLLTALVQPAYAGVNPIPSRSIQPTDITAYVYLNGKMLEFEIIPIVENEMLYIAAEEVENNFNVSISGEWKNNLMDGTRDWFMEIIMFDDSTMGLWNKPSVLKGYEIITSSTNAQMYMMADRDRSDSTQVYSDITITTPPNYLYGRPVIPVDFIIEHLGYDVKWVPVSVGEAKQTNQTKQTSQEISVFIDNQKIKFDVPPVIENGRTLVPMRAIFEEFQMTVEWDGATRTVTAETEFMKCVELQIGNPAAQIYFKDYTKHDPITGTGPIYKMNMQEIQLDVPAKIVNGRTLVPLRFIAETMGYKVSWDNDTRRVDIDTSY